MSLWRRVFTERRGVVLPLLLFLGANIAVLLLVVWPLRQSVGRAHQEAADARNGLAASMVMQQQARTARASTDDAGLELGTFYRDVLPSGLSEARSLMFWLDRTAADAGVRLRGGQSDYEAVRESRLTRVTSQASLLGEYPDILRFLHAVEVASQFVIIEKVELAQSGSGQPGAGEALELTLEVATYFIDEMPPGVSPQPVGGGH